MCGLVPQAQWEGDSLFPQMLFLFTSKSKMFLLEETFVWFIPPSSYPAQVFLMAGKAQNEPWEIKTWSVP